MKIWDWIMRTIHGDWDRTHGQYYILDELPPVPLDEWTDDEEWEWMLEQDYPA